MAVRETIAIIGTTKESSLFFEKLAGENHHLLLVGKDEGELEILAEKIGSHGQGSPSLKVVPCPRSGCWEADIIAFMDPTSLDDQLVEKIRQVSTQKSVLCISEFPFGPKFLEKQLERVKAFLPHSKVVQVLLDSGKKIAAIFGVDQIQVENEKKIFRDLGFALVGKDEFKLKGN